LGALVGHAALRAARIEREREFIAVRHMAFAKDDVYETLDC
jgi:hypothetical protein